ncbi:hypothetical protein GCM10007424_18360 [Flavobacterium suaedae]|uniref:ATP synthase F1 complex delta/epsilon subunit N-terminal domain-containing protein n=1 Tax=Flavobacterium suaedae TaxID=1767027 RepID=A0ABQ1JXJ6_9FLAO|nr:F0F1 ATP synthase subunit epsilon [Flavobacterium suaedae]GGB78543.1 hypothetical protein GCM10007424_18360 [Flavobacterium suaedae]
MLLEIVSPEGHMFKGEVTVVTVPGVDGEFQMLDNHANIVSILNEGTVKIEANSFADANYSSKLQLKDKQLVLPIKSGTLEMKDNRIIILVD